MGQKKKNPWPLIKRTRPMEVNQHPRVRCHVQDDVSWLELFTSFVLTLLIFSLKAVIVSESLNYLLRRKNVSLRFSWIDAIFVQVVIDILF